LAGVRTQVSVKTAGKLILLDFGVLTFTDTFAYK